MRVAFHCSSLFRPWGSSCKLGGGAWLPIGAPPIQTPCLGASGALTEDLPWAFREAGNNWGAGLLWPAPERQCGLSCAYAQRSLPLCSGGHVLGLTPWAAGGHQGDEVERGRPVRSPGRQRGPKDAGPEPSKACRPPCCSRSCFVTRFLPSASRATAHSSLWSCTLVHSPCRCELTSLPPLDWTVREARSSCPTVCVWT